MTSVDRQVGGHIVDSWAVRLNRAVYRAAHHWFAWFVLINVAGFVAMVVLYWIWTVVGRTSATTFVLECAL